MIGANFNLDFKSLSLGRFYFSPKDFLSGCNTLTTGSFSSWLASKEGRKKRKRLADALGILKSPSLFWISVSAFLSTVSSSPGMDCPHDSFIFTVMLQLPTGLLGTWHIRLTPLFPLSFPPSLPEYKVYHDYEFWSMGKGGGRAGGHTRCSDGVIPLGIWDCKEPLVLVTGLWTVPSVLLSDDHRTGVRLSLSCLSFLLVPDSRHWELPEFGKNNC